jgi:hypothetical protein
LSRPLRDLPRLGQPEPRKPWFVTLTTSALEQAVQRAREQNGQVHVLVDQPLRTTWLRGAVYWPASKRTAFAVLGRAFAVVPSGPLCPLALDAERVGTPVLWDERFCHERASTALCGLVVQGLLPSDELWVAVANNVLAVRDGAAPRPLLDATWIDKARASASAQPRAAALASDWDIALRRYAKFRREPDRYFADSRFAAVRVAGKWWFRR